MPSKDDKQLCKNESTPGLSIGINFLVVPSSYLRAVGRLSISRCNTKHHKNSKDSIKHNEKDEEQEGRQGGSVEHPTMMGRDREVHSSFS